MATLIVSNKDIERTFQGNHAIAVTNNGYIYVVYEIEPNFDVSQAYLKVVRSTDGGATFSDINFPMAYPTGAFSFSLDTDGTNIYLFYNGKVNSAAWGLMLYKYNGSSWSGYYNINIGSAGYVIGTTLLACNSGKEYMLHINQNAAESPTICNLYLDVYTDVSASGQYLVKQYPKGIDLCGLEIGDNNIAYISMHDNNAGANILIVYDLSSHSIISEISSGNLGMYGSLVYSNGFLYCQSENQLYVLKNNQLVFMTTFSNYCIDTTPVTDGTSNLMSVMADNTGAYYSKYNGNNWNTISEALSIPYPIEGINVYRKVVNNTIYCTAYYYTNDNQYLYFFSHSSKLGAPYVTLNNKAAFDGTQSTDLTWNYSDVDGDSQSAYEVVITNISDGSKALDTGKVVSPTASYTLPANSLQTGKSYQWKVRVWDTTDSPSQYSSTGILTVGQAPVATLTYPTAGTVAVSSITTTWVFSSGSGATQASYRLYLTDTNDNILWDTGQISSTTARSKAIDYVLQNNTTYKVKLDLWDSNNLKSTEVVATINISYTAPAIPTVAAYADTVNGSIKFSIINPTPTGTQPTVSYCDIYRDGLRIGSNISDSFIDYTPESQKDYTYKVVAIGSNGTTSQSDDIITSVSIRNALLSLVSDYTQFVKLIYDPSRQHNKTLDRTLMHFAGRSKAVSEFSENEDTALNLSFSIFDEDILNELGNLISSKQTLLYKDNRKRKIFCTCNELNIEDDISGGWKVSFNLNEVDYQEGV